MKLKAREKKLAQVCICGVVLLGGAMTGNVFLSVMMGLAIVFLLLPRPTSLIERFREWRERRWPDSHAE